MNKTEWKELFKRMGEHWNAVEEYTSKPMHIHVVVEA